MCNLLRCLKEFIVKAICSEITTTLRDEFIGQPLYDLVPANIKPRVF